MDSPSAILMGFQAVSLGPFIGTWCNTSLYGVIATLTFYYFLTYRRDRIIVKILVLISFITLTFQTAGLAWGQWESLVQHAGDPMSVATNTKGEMIALAAVPIPVFLAKVLYAERCFWVSSNKGVLLVAIFTIAVSTVSSIGFVVARLQPLTTYTTDQIDVWLKIYLWSAVLNDVWLSGAFAYSIRKIRKDLPHHPASDVLLSSLIQVALITSFITTIGAFAAAVAELFSKESVVYVFFLQVMPQLYLLSVLITLNSRRRIKARVMTHVNAEGYVVGPTRRAHRGSREKKADSLPYRSLNRPSVQYGSGARGDARGNGIGVDCETYQQIEILEKDSFYPEVSQIPPPPVAITSVNRNVLPLHMDPLPYHSSFDALVIPRRLFDELEISLQHNVNGSALSHVNFGRTGRSSISADTIGTSNDTIGSGSPGLSRRCEGFKLFKPDTWSSYRRGAKIRK